MTASGSPRALAASIALTGLVAGTLDMTAAVVQYMSRGGTEPVRILIYIASGALGPWVFDGPPAWVAAAGLGFHYLIAFTWTVLFFVAFPRLQALRRSPLVIGPLYGVVVWFVMNRVVVPLSRVPKPKAFDPTQAAIACAILIVCIGLPIALGASRHFRPL